MTVPAKIPESKEDSRTSKSMEVYQHVLKPVMDIQNEDEIQSFSKWMNYVGYDNITDLCTDFYQILDVGYHYQAALLQPHFFEQEDE